MVREESPFVLSSAWWNWLQVVGVLIVVGLLLSWLFASIRRGGVGRGFGSVWRQALESAADLFGMTFRRIYALAQHSVKESLRKRILLVFVVFAAVFLFAGWFIRGDSPEQVKITISFVLTATSYLLLPAILLLVAWSLPGDIKARTLHTVVTKPVRRSEVVLGRALGFTFIGTLVLLTMGAVSLAYVYRSVPPSEREELVARVPVYGTLSFLDRDGRPVREGRNVGHSWTYRSYIEGGTEEAAVWTFGDIPVNRLGDQLPLELTFEVFRTHKGDIGEGVRAVLTLINPQTGRSWMDYPFEVQEYQIVRRTIPRHVQDANTGESIDVFRDLVHEGELRVEARCISQAQLIGMARADLYIKAADASFLVNFAKGLFGIWLQMFLVVSIGVVASTFLSGPVAGLTTFAVVLCGFFIGFLRDLATGSIEGGGPLESLHRIWTGRNSMVELEPTFWVNVMQNIDAAFAKVMWALTFTVPDLAGYNTASFVANGFDIPMDVLGPNMLKTFAYAVPTLVLGYFFLKMREIAK